jgi:hypothetical protein
VQSLIRPNRKESRFAVKLTVNARTTEVKKRGSPCLYQTPSRSQCPLRWGMPLVVTPDIGG